METIKIKVYTRQDLEESLLHAQDIVEELDGEELTLFGQFRLNRAKKVVERINRWLNLNLETYMEHNGQLVNVTIKPIEQ